MTTWLPHVIRGLTRSRCHPAAPICLPHCLIHTCARLPTCIFAGCTAGRRALAGKQLIHAHALDLPPLFVLSQVACCYRLFHAQDMVVTTHDCGSHRRAHLPSELGDFTSPVHAGNPVTLGSCPFCPAHKPFSSSALASHPGIESPFPSPPASPLLLVNLNLS